MILFQSLESATVTGTAHMFEEILTSDLNL
jgi:hypothetical protein